MKKTNSFEDDFKDLSKEQLIKLKAETIAEKRRLLNIIELTTNDKSKSDDERYELCSKLTRAVNFYIAKYCAIDAAISAINFQQKRENRKCSIVKLELKLLKQAVKEIVGADERHAIIKRHAQLISESDEISQLESHFSKSEQVAK